MEASLKLRHVIVMLAVIAMTPIAGIAAVGSYRTTNFIVQAPSPELARQVGDAAERYRRELAVYWTGQPLPRWPMPCPIHVVAGNLLAQGVTTYNPQPVSDFNMEVIGTPERILDSVLPHEVTHTVLATHFGRPLPRWADEGICTTVEHTSERVKHERKLREFLASRRGIAMNTLFKLTEYPRDVLPMYAQGYSVCQFLIAQRGPKTFISFLGDYMNHPRSRNNTRWTENVRQHYGYESLAQLQEYWLAWVESGSGDVTEYAKIASISNSTNNDSRAISADSGIRLAAATSMTGIRPIGAPSRADQVPSINRSLPEKFQPNEILALNGPNLAHASSTDSAHGSRVQTNPVRQTDPESRVASGSWYSRNRDRNGQPAPRSTYQAAQPQSEQIYGQPAQTTDGPPTYYGRRYSPADQTIFR